MTKAGTGIHALLQVRGPTTVPGSESVDERRFCVAGGSIRALHRERSARAPPLIRERRFGQFPNWGSLGVQPFSGKGGASGGPRGCAGHGAF